jgi:hypothetical protein
MTTMTPSDIMVSASSIRWYPPSFDRLGLEACILSGMGDAGLAVFYQIAIKQTMAIV